MPEPSCTKRSRSNAQGGDFYNVASHLSDLAEVEIVGRRLPAARHCVIESIRPGVGIDDVWQLSEALMLLAVVLPQGGQPPRGAPGHGRDRVESAARGLSRIREVDLCDEHSPGSSRFALRHMTNAAAEGRRVGRLEILRAVLAAESS